MKIAFTNIKWTKKLINRLFCVRHFMLLLLVFFIWLYWFINTPISRDIVIMIDNINTEDSFTEIFFRQEGSVFKGLIGDEMKNPEYLDVTIGGISKKMNDSLYNYFDNEYFDKGDYFNNASNDSVQSFMGQTIFSSVPLNVKEIDKYSPLTQETELCNEYKNNLSSRKKYKDVYRDIIQINDSLFVSYSDSLIQHRIQCDEAKGHIYASENYVTKPFLYTYNTERYAGNLFPAYHHEIIARFYIFYDKGIKYDVENDLPSEIPDSMIIGFAFNNSTEIKRITPAPDWELNQKVLFYTEEAIEDILYSGISIYAEDLSKKSRNEMINFLLATIIGIFISICTELFILDKFRTERKE